MTDNERNTKFLGFAKLLSDEIQNALRAADDHENLFDLEHTIIAQRAYDLAEHVLYETSQGMDRVFGIPYKLEQVPDLTSWPPPK